MMENQNKLDLDAIEREARQLRAQTIAQIAHRFVSLFRRKPVGKVATA